MSSLSQQLSQLKLQDQTLQKKSDVIAAASLLFHSKVASGIDLETIFSLACAGFSKLTSKDERLAEFSEVIFGPKYRRIDRNILTKPENDELSAKLCEFLCVLSLHFLDEDAHKVIDYLLRNFHVHHYEAESIIVYFMHYHATPFYTRLLQNVVLKTREHFGFLNTPISKGEQVLRETIAKQINHDSHILAALIAYNLKLSKKLHSQADSGAAASAKGQIVFSMVEESNKKATAASSSQALKVDPTSFLQALLIDLLRVKNELTDTFIGSLIETINHFLRRGDDAAMSFALIALGSLISRDKNINARIIEEFANFLIAKIPQINSSKSMEIVWKFIVFLLQRNVLKRVSIPQLTKLSESYSSDSSVFRGVFEKIGASHSSLNVFAVSFTTILSTNSKATFDACLPLLEGIIDVMQSHDSIYGHVNPEMKESMLHAVIFDRFFNGLAISSEINATVISIMKKHFLADLIHYLNARIAEETNSSEESNRFREFMTSHFPGSLSFHENILLKRNMITLVGGSAKNQKKGAKESREYLTAILAMLNGEASAESNEVLQSYIEYILNVVCMKLAIDSNTRTLKLLLEILVHPSIIRAQNNISDEARQIQSKVQSIAGFFKFLIANLRTSSTGATGQIDSIKAEIVNAFRVLCVESSSIVASRRGFIVSSFFVLAQCEDLADSTREIYAAFKESMPDVFTEKLTKRAFPMVDLLLSSKGHFDELLASIYAHCGGVDSQEVLVKQGLANFLANVFDNAETLSLSTSPKTLNACVEIIESIQGGGGCSSSSVDCTLLNRQICKFVSKSVAGNARIASDVRLVNFVLEQRSYDNLVIVKEDLIDRLGMAQSCLLLAKKFMYTVSSSNAALQGNVKALFMINSMLKSEIEKVPSELACQLFTLVLIKLSRAVSQEKQGLFIIMENTKKILKKSTSDFNVRLLSDAFEGELNRAVVKVNFKILLNLCEIIGKHKVELAVHNPPIGKIIAKDLMEQQSNKQRDLNSVLRFFVSQIHSEVPAEFLVDWVEIFADIIKSIQSKVVATATAAANAIKVDEDVLFDLLNALRGNSNLVTDARLLGFYVVFYTTMAAEAKLNASFAEMYLDVFVNRVVTLVEVKQQQQQSNRVTMVERIITAVDAAVFSRLTQVNQLEYLRTIVRNVRVISFDGVAAHLLSLPFSQATCADLLNVVKSEIESIDGMDASSKSNSYAQVTFVLETLLLLREPECLEELSLDVLFGLVDRAELSARIRVQLLRIVKIIEKKNVRLLHAFEAQVKNLCKPTEAEAQRLKELKSTITGGDVIARYIESLKRELNANMPVNNDVKSDVNDDSEESAEASRQIDINKLEIVHEAAEILCLMSAVNFKRISNLLFDAMEACYKGFITSNVLLNSQENKSKDEIEIEDELETQQKKKNQSDEGETRAQILESKVEFVFELFAFIATKLMGQISAVRQNKLVRFSLLHLQAVFALLPYFSVQKTSILTKLRQLSEVYGGPSNLLRVLFVAAAERLSDERASEIILKELPSAIVSLMFSPQQQQQQSKKGSNEVSEGNNNNNDFCAAESLENFMEFVKGIFVQWAWQHNKIACDEDVNSLMHAQNSLIAKHLSITANRPNACKVFVRNAAILVHAIFANPAFARVLESKQEKTEELAQVFFKFYYEFIRFENLMKNALSRSKESGSKQIEQTFFKPLKKILVVYAKLHSSFIKLFEIDVFFTICALILDNSHKIHYSIRSAILDLMNTQLDAATVIKKKHHTAIIRIVTTIHQEIQANLHTIYLKDDSSKQSKEQQQSESAGEQSGSAIPAKSNGKKQLQSKEKRQEKQAQLNNNSARSIEKYLTNCIVLITTALDRKPALFHATAAISNASKAVHSAIDSAALLETLLEFTSNLSYSFTMKTSLIFLIANLAAQGNKFRVLPHLHSLAGEILQEALGLLYFTDKDSFDRLITVAISSTTSKKAQQQQTSSAEMNAFIKETFDSQRLEQSVFSQTQYFKHSETIIRNVDSLFTLLTRSIENFILCLRNLISPYLPLIALALFSFAQKASLAQPLSNFIKRVSELVESRVLLESILLPQAEVYQSISSNAVEFYTLLMEQTFIKIDADTLDAFLPEIYKKIFLNLDYTRKQYLNAERYAESTVDAVESAQVKAVAALVVKTNEIQLRKFFLNIVTWSERVFAEHECGFRFVAYRKIILLKIVRELSETMTSLFTPFFHFVFETQLAVISDFVKMYGVGSAENDAEQSQGAAMDALKKSMNKKRTREEVHTNDSNAVRGKLSLKLLSLNLVALRSCFAHDKEEFIDSARFQTLSEPLVSLFDAYGFNSVQDYNEVMESAVTPTILALFNLIKDDYKWKTLNYSLMLKTRSENSKIRLAVLRTVEKLLEALGERYIVLVNDILPFISETLDDLDQDVERTSKAIVIKLEEISGENIREYFKAK